MRALLFAASCGFLAAASDVRRADAQQAAAKAAAAGVANAEQAIRASAEQFVAAFNKGDAKAIAALWATDGDYVDESGELSSGREAIEKKYADYFAAEQGAKIAVTVEAVRLVGPDTAIEDGSSAVSVAAQAVPIPGRYTVVHVKRDGKWQMASVRDLPAESPTEGEPLQDLAWMIGSWRAERLGAEIVIDCRWLADKSFVEATYSKRAGETLTPAATQIIGVNPHSGRIMSWMFNGDGGIAAGDWRPTDAGWSIDYEGVTTDGLPSTAVNVLFRVNDALVWQSTNRQVAGEPLADTEEVVLKRLVPENQKNAAAH